MTHFRFLYKQTAIMNAHSQTDELDFSANIEVIAEDNEHICGVKLSQKQTVITVGLIVIIILIVLVAFNIIEAKEIRDILRFVKGE